MGKLSYLHINPTAPNTYITLNDAMKKNAENCPDTEAFIYRNEHGDRRSITFGDLYERGQCVAQYLVTSGVQRQDKVALFGPNTLARIVAEFGILLAGAVVLHLNVDVKTASDTNDILEKAKCKVVFVDPGENDIFLPTIQKLINECQLIFLRKPGSAYTDPVVINDIQTSCDTSVKLPEVQPEDEAIIFTTSGSTGKPKMVIHCHFDFTLGLEAYFELLPESKKTFNDRPFCWLGGSQAFATVSGSTIVFTDSNLGSSARGIKLIWKIITEEKVTDGMFMPYCLYDLLAEQDNIKDDGYRLETIMTGGQVIDKECTKVIGRFCKKIGVGYGSTEVMGVSFILIENSEDFETGCVGKPIPGVEVRIVGENGQVVPVGEEGELQIRSSFLTKGYYADEEMTNRAYTKDRPSWFRIEDIGKMTESGELIMRGRVKENISRGGRKILPGVVDDVVKKMEGISLVATVAVPDVRLYEEVCVCYTATDGVDLSPSDVELYCKQNFSTEETGDGMGSSPTYFIRFDSFPTVFTGKVDKQTLKRQAAERLNLTLQLN
ncbi:3-[(3aS,4S,7aS)-7a-methyl-1,5-dioxo-octahydro-1H-inden-4-yl]propanoyl:CoA ligase-like [Argopecten irradians]|uniref:3-[(3aS,4S,7aS)-7a-methyl-1, 5-dioxo-octahydro-1H-inden-4-yl]propanoyl:CoA ligase-like n=1 Tax=Argopecten irradians TaxID=31199 RepID=UPI003710EA08